MPTKLLPPPARRAAAIVAAACAALPTGCANLPDAREVARSVSPFAQPTPSLESRIAAMRVGVTTADDARARLGEPVAEWTADDGRRLLTWDHFEGGLSPAGLVPIANLFTTRSASTLVRSQLVFGQDERLAEIRQSRRRLDGAIVDPEGAARPAVPWGVPR